MNATAFDHARFADCAAQIIHQTRELAAKGWTPATAGNFSVRMNPELVAITSSGKDKGRLTESDIMVVDLQNRPVETVLRPSAETALHTHLYRRFPEVGAVLHTHSPTQTIAGLLNASEGRVRLQGYELFKALRGHHTHDATFDLPVVPNEQDMDVLIEHVDKVLQRMDQWGYLIAGHGLYAWGADINEARRHLDAFEFILSCELEMRRLRA